MINHSSQNEMIWAHLLFGHVITQLKAYRQFGCVNLSGRICELKEWLKVNAYKDTHIIISPKKKVKSGKWVSHYQLVRKEK